MYKTSTDSTSLQTNLAAFGPVSERASEVQRAITLDVILKTGNRWAFPYAYLVAVEFDKSGKLVLHFTSHTVTLEGQYLESIYEALLNHEVGFICEQRRGYSSYADEKKTHIDRIAVTSNLNANLKE